METEKIIKGRRKAEEREGYKMIANMKEGRRKGTTEKRGAGEGEEGRRNVTGEGKEGRKE
jgi:hypothetical protein